MANAFVPHDPTGGFMENGGDRSFTERTGMTPTGGMNPIVNDAGRGTINDLSPDLLRTFEEFLPIDPPIDQARFTTRGRVGSFSYGRMPRARPFSEPTVHLPGATVLSGWQADAFIAGLDTAFRTVLSGGNPAFALLTPFSSSRTILNACDAAGITLALGVGLTAGADVAGSGSVGVVFAPGQRIGFYGSGGFGGGWIWSAGGSAQVTLIKGGPELMDGRGSLLSTSIGTLGWVTADLVDAPIGVSLVSGGNGAIIGVSFEFGLSVGVPILGLISAYAQETHTTTSFGRRPGSRSLAATGPASAAHDAALREAVARGASPVEAEAFLAAMFP
jgi:hypothetical protein